MLVIVALGNLIQVQLKQIYGRENVYVWTDHDNGGLDLYCAEPILFLDEFKGMAYKEFLKVTDVYPAQLHARYTNTAYIMECNTHCFYFHTQACLLNGS